MVAVMYTSNSRGNEYCVVKRISKVAVMSTAW